ncbi:MAG: LamG-like jellyroll fold domain-containing protein [Thermoguttaceae bacterium]
MMKPEAGRDDELPLLLSAMVDGEATAAQEARLAELLHNNPALQQVYVDFCWTHALLRRELTARGQLPSILDECGDALTSDSNLVEPAVDAAPCPTTATDIPPVVVNPSSALPSPISLFGVTVGEWAIPYGVATALVGLAILGAWFYTFSLDRNKGLPAGHNVAHVEKPAQPTVPAGDRVGRVTGIVDCRCRNATAAPHDAEPISRGRKYVLDSGLLEFAYDSGVKVVLQGPCVYEVDSDRGGFLSRGKLVARVERAKSEIRNPKSEQHSPLSPLPSHHFVVRTPTATVTDLGTEFGVEVDEQGMAAAQVIEGKIEVRPVEGKGLAKVAISGADGEARQRPILLVAGQSVRVAKGADGHRLDVVRGKADAEAFPARPGRLAEYVQQQRSKLFRRWQAFGEELRKRGDLLAYYDFQPDTGEPLAMRNRAATGHAFDGWIRGGTWVPGSFPGKRAMRFAKPDDGVHVEISAECRQITLAAWVRIDALSKSFNSLLVSDGWGRPGQTHWQLSKDGMMMFSAVDARDAGVEVRSPRPVLGNADFGQWRFLAVTCDRATGKVRFYADGEPAGEQSFAASRSATFQFGPAMIGCWNDWQEPPANDRTLSGCVEELMVFRAVLSETEIRQLNGRGGVSVVEKKRATLSESM